MTEREAIYRLKEHFRIHDDGRPTPLLDEAEVMAYQALVNQLWLREMLIDYEKDPTATKGHAIMNDIYKLFVYRMEDNKSDVIRFKNGSFIEILKSKDSIKPTKPNMYFFINEEIINNGSK